MQLSNKTNVVILLVAIIAVVTIIMKSSCNADVNFFTRKSLLKLSFDRGSHYYFFLDIWLLDDRNE